MVYPGGVAVTSLEAGSVVGRRYRLERELSRQGGMGVVWIATHLVTKRRVAIKLLRAGGHDDAASRARLLREARASCAVDHPSVLPVLDVIDADGAPALVMELLEGESLRERLERRGALGVAETCAILAPVAGALAAAHAARIVHRDIKPENIFLVGGGGGGEPTVKVLDFGIAKIVATEETTSNLTESGAMLGTPYYMAPEQAFGERDVGAAADAWALGIVLYECLTGARPTQADNLGQVIKRITRDPIAPIEEHVPGVPPALATLVARLLERDVAAREIDMKRAAKTLVACAAPGESGTPTSVVKSTKADPPKRRAPLVVLALGVALVLGLVANAGRWSGPLLPRSERGAGAAASASAPSTALTAAPSSPAPPSSAAPSASAPGPSVKATSPAPKALSVAVAPSAPPAATATPLASAAGPASPDAGSTGPGHVITTTPF